MKKIVSLLLIVALLLVGTVSAFALGDGPIDQGEKGDVKEEEETPIKESTSEKPASKMPRLLTFKAGSGAALSFVLHTEHPETLVVKLNEKEISDFTYENGLLTLSADLMSSLEAHSYSLLICAAEGNIGYAMDIIPEVVVRAPKKAAPTVKENENTEVTVSEGEPI